MKLSDLRPAEIVVLTGEPGCGTTTLLESWDGPGVALLPQPPGDDWDYDDVVQQGLGPDHLVGREMGSMSSGERQRVRLARFLARTEPVLLLDEPFAYLDLRGTHDLLAALRADGRPLLAVCKGMEVVHQAADRLLVLADGTVREGR